MSGDCCHHSMLRRSGECCCDSLYCSQSESHWAAGEVGDLGEGRSTAINKGVREGVFMTML
jgi:hypothetical protein